MAEKPRVVFDTSVVLQAGLRPAGPAGRVLSLVDRGLFTLYASEAGLAEWLNVLTRPSIRARNPHLTGELSTALLERLRRCATVLPAVPAHFQCPRDPDDEHVLNLAIEADAHYLLSRDRDLLDLMDEGRLEGREFRQRYPGLTILDPVAFLAELNPPPAP